MTNRLRVKEIIADHNKLLQHWEVPLKQNQYTIAKQCIPFEMTDNTKSQLLAKWNNGKALSKLTCEVLFKLRATLDCTYGELIGRTYTKVPKDCNEETFLIKKWIAYEASENVLDAFIKLSDEYMISIDFILLTEEENLMP